MARLSITLLASAIMACAAYGQNTGRSYMVMPRVVTLKKDTVGLFMPAYRKSVIIFANNYNCISCFESLARFLDGLHIDTGMVQTMAICRSGPSASTRRGQLDKMRNIFPSLQRVVFEIQDSSDEFPPVNVTDGVFGAYVIRRTPSIMVSDNTTGESLALVRYDEMFDETGTNLRKEAADRIAHAIYNAK